MKKPDVRKTLMKDEDSYREALRLIDAERMDTESKPLKRREMQLPNGAVLYVYEDERTPAMENKTVEPGCFYRHYKGGLYYVNFVAEHTETGELLVIYTKCNDHSKTYARPLTMFIEKVGVGEDGEPILRFTEE